jgi:hypothetical protein
MQQYRYTLIEPARDALVNPAGPGQQISQHECSLLPPTTPLNEPINHSIKIIEPTNQPTQQHNTTSNSRESSNFQKKKMGYCCFISEPRMVSWQACQGHFFVSHQKSNGRSTSPLGLHLVWRLKKTVFPLGHGTISPRREDITK